MLLLFVPIAAPFLLYYAITSQRPLVPLSLGALLCATALWIEVGRSAGPGVDAGPGSDMVGVTALVLGLTGLSFLGGAWAARQPRDGFDRVMLTAGLMVAPPAVLALAQLIRMGAAWLGVAT